MHELTSSEGSLNVGVAGGLGRRWGLLLPLCELPGEHQGEGLQIPGSVEGPLGIRALGVGAPQHGEAP